MSTATFVEPRVAVWPEGVSSAGREAVDLAAMAGLELDAWQAFVLERSLAEREDGRWAASEVGVNVPRQNGKGAILEARELAGLFLLGERLIIHSAHEFATSRDHQLRLETLVKNTPEFHRRVAAYKHAHGEEGIYLKDGRRLLFRTRTKGGGRGFSADLVVFDEAMILPESTIGALMPTLSARPNPQIWYTGSAVDQALHLDGLVWARVRERGVAGESGKRLAYFEWSAPAVDPSQVSGELAADRDAWAAANPALGGRIDPDHVETERGSMDPRTFAVERLGVGDWPNTDGTRRAVVDWAEWVALGDPSSSVDGPVAFAFDVAPDRRSAAICAAGLRADGRVHVEVVDHRPGVGWVADRLGELVERHANVGVVCDGASPAASLAEDVDAVTTSTGEYVAACGRFVDLAADGGLVHLSSRELDAAVRGATRRTVGDAWAWSRRSSQVDISPLVAGTLAVWQAQHVSPGGVWDPDDAELEAIFA